MRKFAQPDSGSIRELLNNAKILSPLISAAIMTHGGASSEEFRAVTEELGRTLDESVEKVLREIIPEGDVPVSIRASTSVALAPIVAHIWTQSPDEMESSKISEAFLGLVKFTRPDPGMVFNPHMPRASSHALAEARAASRILPVLFKLEALPPQTRKLFIGGNSVSEFRDTCLNDIRDMAKIVAVQLESSDFRQQDIAYRSALNCLSEVYAESLMQEYRTLNRKLHELRSASSAEKTTQFLQKIKENDTPMILRQLRPKIKQAMALLYPVTDASSDMHPEI